jgi:hypothetical protein
MNALGTARKVLDWSTAPQGPLPVGPLLNTVALARPDAEALAALRRLALVTTARLGLGAELLRDSGSIGLGAILLAAAVGGRLEAAVAEKIIQGVPRLSPSVVEWNEATVRHGVVGAALGPLPAGPPMPEPVVDKLLECSPLTAVLHRPAAGQAQIARSTARRLLRRSRGRGVLIRFLSEPSVDAAVLDWRSEMLELLRAEQPEMMLDIYTAARASHGTVWDCHINRADAELRKPNLPPQLPLATLRYWAPLARMERDLQAGRGMAARIRTAAGQAAAPAADHLRRRIFLRPGEYGQAVRLVVKYRLLAVMETT